MVVNQNLGGEMGTGPPPFRTLVKIIVMVNIMVFELWHTNLKSY